MNPVQFSSPSASRHAWLRDALLIALVLAGLWGSGCASTTQAEKLAAFVTKAPLPTLVPRDQVLATAERVAAEHEGDFVLRGTGRSMEPAYVAGTVLVVHPTSLHMLRKGMAVVYTNNRGTVAHMLLEKTERGWIAIGLNNADPDSALVTERNLVGVVKHAFAADDTVLPPEIANQISLQRALGGGAPMALLR